MLCTMTRRGCGRYYIVIVFIVLIVHLSSSHLTCSIQDIFSPINKICRSWEENHQVKSRHPDAQVTELKMTRGKLQSKVVNESDKQKHSATEALRFHNAANPIQDPVGVDVQTEAQEEFRSKVDAKNKAPVPRPIVDSHSVGDLKLQMNSCDRPSGAEGQQDAKIILFWTTFFGRWDYEFGLGREPFSEHNCPVSNCLTSNDPSLLPRASAVVFHMRNVGRDTVFPPIRFPNQSYVFFLQESPYNQWNDLKQYNGVFNLTMTYRRDSDVPVPYGLLTTRSAPFNVTPPPPPPLLHDDLLDLVAGKTKLIAWFASNCGPTHSRREEYVKELQKYTEVDVYGTCGPYSCPNKKSLLEARKHPDCYTMLERNYKFYLSFENTVCKDYITEKVFNVLGKYVVPVVYGGGNYSAVVPSRSVINVQDFASPKHLVGFLQELDKNDERYMEYFDWKKQFGVLSERQARGQGFCKLCHILNDPQQPRQVHDKLDAWWDKEGSCDLNMP